MSETDSPETAVVEAFLIGCLPFDALPAPVRRQCARSMTVRYLRRRHILGEAGLYVVRSGEIDWLGDSGELLQRFDEGDVFVVDEHTGGASAAAHFHCRSDALIYHLPGSAYRQLAADFSFVDHFIQAQAGLTLRLAAGHSSHPMGLSQLVSQWMTREVLCCSATEPVSALAARMTARRVSSALVMDGDELVGIVTDRDVRSRLVAAGLSGEASVQTIMTPAPVHVDAGQSLLDAVLTMTQHRIHHLPVLAVAAAAHTTAKPAALAGIITASDIFLAGQEDPVFFVQHLSRQHSVQALAGLMESLPRMFSSWAGSGLPAHQVGQLSNMVSEALTRRLIELAIDELGPAPGAFCWLCFGSQARGEQLLGGDQDNGLLIADAVDDADLHWFASLARFVCDGLNRCGYVYCPGGVMATSPQWRQRLSDWQATVDAWMRSPTPEAVMRVSIFFDLKSLWGDSALLAQLQSHMLAHTHRNSIFQAALARNVLDSSPPLGVIRGFVVERSGEHRDQFNLKKRGALPIIELVRLWALAAGLSEVGTVPRLQALQQRKLMAAEDASALLEAFALISALRIALQARQWAAAEPVNNYCAPDTLSRLQRAHLRGAFKVVHDAQTAVRNHFLAGGA